MGIFDYIKLLVGVILVGITVYFTHQYDTGQETKRVLAAEFKARQTEEQYAKAIAAASDSYSGKLKEVQDAKDAADKLNGTRGVFVRAKCPNNVPQTATSSSGGDGTTAVQLSTAYGAAFDGYAADAQTIAERLMACQAILASERK